MKGASKPKNMEGEMSVILGNMPFGYDMEQETFVQVKKSM